MPTDPLLQVQLETFSPFEGEIFNLSSERSESLDLTLRDVRRLGGESDAREPFSLIFLGPAEPILPQGIYTLMHERLGPLDIFLVPVGPDRARSGIRYEAVFS